MHSSSSSQSQLPSTESSKHHRYLASDGQRWFLTDNLGLAMRSSKFFDLQDHKLVQQGTDGHISTDLDIR